MRGAQQTGAMSISGPGSMATFAGLARQVYAGPARLGRVRLVAVDGPSGAGKSTFAERLATACVAAVPTPPAVAVVHTDDLLDGWHDQFTFWPRLHEWVLGPLGAGRPARYRRYDWVAGRFRDGWTVVDPPDVLVIEGVSAARAAIRPTVTLSVFVTAAAPVRLARSLARDGAAMQPALDRWRRAEERFFTTDGTAAAVDLVVDTSGAGPADPSTYRRVGGRADVDAGGAGGAPSAR